MRKFNLMVFPLMLVICLFCGCAASGDADAMCEFDCDSVINLKLGTADPNDAVACAPLLTNTLIQNIAIEYDDTVISYSVATGRIVALRAGSTKIKTTLNGVTKSVQVNVTDAVYCNDLRVIDFVMEYGKPADLLAYNRNYLIANSGYNMGYTFESLTPEVLSVDALGVITANSCGQGIIKVAAKVGVNPNTPSGYDIVFRTICVTVVEQRMTLELTVLDKNMNELDYVLDASGAKNYTVYSTTNGSLNYYLKISSDQSLSNCLFTENTTYFDCLNLVLDSDNQRLVRQSDLYQKSQDERVVYQSFYLVDSGIDAIEKHILDAGYNFYYSSYSEKIWLNVYKLTTESDISVRVLNADLSPYGNVDLNNDYCLYDDAEGNLTNFVYVDIIVNRYCEGKLAYESNNLTVEAEENGLLKVSAGATGGVATLTIWALDGSNACTTIGFYVYKMAVTITTQIDKNIIYLVDGEALFTANYAVHNEDGDLLKNQDLEFVFVDSDSQPVYIGKNKVRYYDASYPTLVVEFVCTGKYTLLLKSVGNEYYSDVIFIYVYDEKSLTK